MNQLGSIIPTNEENTLVFSRTYTRSFLQSLGVATEYNDLIEIPSQYTYKSLVRFKVTQIEVAINWLGDLFVTPMVVTNLLPDNSTFTNVSILIKGLHTFANASCGLIVDVEVELA